MMLLGMVIALGPLAWVWLRNRHAAPAQRLRVLTLITLFLTFDLVLFGAFTRLTDSGLGCPDWPGCYGHMSPVGAKASIAAAQEAMPTGPVTHSKAWVEMVHRYLATAVGVLILVLASVSWVERKRLSVWHGWPLLDPVLGLFAGGFRRAHRHHEAVPGHRDPAFAGRHGVVGVVAHAGRGLCLADPAAAGAVAVSTGVSARCCGLCLPCSGCRSRSVAGSAPITRCWLAASSRPAKAVGGQPWIFQRLHAVA